MAWRKSVSALVLGGAIAVGGCSAIVSPDEGLLGGAADGGGGIDTGTGGTDSSLPPADSGVAGDSSVPMGDSAVVVDSGVTPDCDFMTRCAGDRLETCAEGTISDMECPLGCEEAGGSAACLEMVPSNVGAELWQAGAPNVVIDVDRAFDTTECTLASVGTTIVDQGDAGELCVISAGDFEIHETATLEVRGSRPLVIMAAGEVHIVGALDLAAHGDLPGAGGYPGGRVTRDAEGWNGAGAFGGMAGAHEGSYDDGGGAGGGLCGAGGAGGAGGSAAGGLPGGAVSPTWELVPLYGGSGGGRGRGYISTMGRGSNAGPGGPGGGALQISTRSRIRVSGVITVAGAGGFPGLNRFSSSAINWGSAGGGGAGGAVLLEAPEIRFDGGWVIASGGGGGGGGGSTDGVAGEDGGEGTASGGTGDAVRGADGGNGSALAELAGQPGADNTASNANGGGGGGGAGCVLFRTVDATLDGMASTHPVLMPGLRTMPVRR